MSSVGESLIDHDAGSRRLSDEGALSTATPSLAGVSDAEGGREPKRRRVAGSVIQPGRIPRRKAACQQCRARKVKCDNVRPMCGNCQLDGSGCIYVDPPPDQPV